MLAKKLANRPETLCDPGAFVEEAGGLEERLQIDGYNDVAEGFPFVHGGRISVECAIVAIEAELVGFRDSDMPGTDWRRQSYVRT